VIDVYHTSWPKFRTCRLIVYIFLSIYPSYGCAGVWLQTTTVRVSGEYDSNPTMTGYANREGIWRSVFAPGYTLKNSSEQNELNAGVALQIERSSNQLLSQNRSDPSLFAGFHHQGEAGEFGLTAKYDETATRNNLIDNAGQNFTDSTRTAHTITGNWTKELSEYSTLSVDGSYERVSYKGGSFVDYTNQSVGGRFSRAVSDRSTLFMRVSNNKYKPVTGATSSNISNAALGWDWIYSENLHGTLQAGKSWTENVGSGNQGAVTVNYSGQRNDISFNVGRQVAASGLGNLVTIDQANGSWTYTMSETSRLGIEAGWQKSRLFTDAFYRTTSTWFQKELNQFWVVRMYYQHKSSDQVGIGKAYSNMSGLAFNYTHADF